MMNADEEGDMFEVRRQEKRETLRGG